jgi:glutamine synthetase
MTEQYSILEYVWIDGFNNLRSKTKIMHQIFALNEVPIWNFDGSSTGQAEGHKSDVILGPVRMFKDPFRKHQNNFIIMCETLNVDNTPHTTNYRAKCIQYANDKNNNNSLFGFEQEYFIYKADISSPLGWINEDRPHNIHQKCGPFYCGNGADKSYGRNIVEEHVKNCLYAGIKICGINQEVTPSQWEYQIGVVDAFEGGDHLWISRFILNKTAELHNATIVYNPKPMENWNGSGCHTNFSTQQMREKGGMKYIIEACDKLSKVQDKHLEAYGGEENKKRLTGIHETASYKKFTYGVSDRGASVRIPLNVATDGFGYLEDRRPSSNIDPYRVITVLLDTICSNQKQVVIQSTQSLEKHNKIISNKELWEKRRTPMITKN